jgi:hypothetical protein
MASRNYGTNTFHIKVDTTGLDRLEREILARAKNPSAPLKAWALEVGRDIALSWDRMKYGALYLKGGIFRGEVPWRPVPPMYTRKDGTKVPPWGGVPRVAGSGVVKGRKRRNSGKRVTIGSTVGADTAKMRREFTGKAVLSTDKRTISLVTNRSYAGPQNALRPFNRATRKDRDLLVRLFREWLRKMADDIRRRRGAA